MQKRKNIFSLKYNNRKQINGAATSPTSFSQNIIGNLTFLEKWSSFDQLKANFDPKLKI